eukprot:m.276072 g.276072  ORF g.276072 m.276072 type:complete len:1434 (+) comp17693_c2_seq2:1525-5826(+)
MSLSRSSDLPPLSGYLCKMKPRSKGWDKRYFKTVEDRLEYYADETSSTAKGTIALLTVMDVRTCSFTEQQVDGKLRLSADQGLQIQTASRTYNLICEDKTAYNRWLTELPKHVQHWQTQGPATRNSRSKSLLSSVGLRRSASATSRTPSEMDEEPELDVRPADPTQLLLEANSRSSPRSGGETSDDEDLALPADDEPSPDFANINAEEDGSSQGPAPIMEAEEEEEEGEAEDRGETGETEVPSPSIAQVDAPLSNGAGLRQRAGSQLATKRTEASASVSAPQSQSQEGTSGMTTTLKLGIGRGQSMTFPGTFTNGLELVSKLQDKMASTLDAEACEAITVWYVDSLGTVTELASDVSPHTIVSQGARLYVVFQDRALMAFHFPTGRFVADVVPLRLKVSELFHLKSTDWKAAKSFETQLKPLFQKQPGLFWRTADNTDSKFAQADSFVNFVIKQQRLGNHGKLVIKSSMLERPVVSARETGAKRSKTRPLRLRDMLFKRGASTMAASSTWKQRWCVLGDGALQYFEKVVDQTPKGLITIEDMTSVKPVREDAKDARPHTFVITTSKKRNYVFSADSADTLDKWVDTLTRLIRKADKVGYLYKRGDKFSSTWRHRWFVLKGSQLLYYENENSPAAKSDVDLSKALAVEPIDEKDILDDFCFRLDCGKREYILRADTELEMLDWISAILVNMPKHSVMKCGMVSKKGERNTAWKQRFLELSSTQLAYFEDEDAKSFKGAIPLARLQEVSCVSGKMGTYCFDVIALSRTYEFRAESDADRGDWVTAIRQCADQLQTQAKAAAAAPASRRVSRQVTMEGEELGLPTNGHVEAEEAEQRRSEMRPVEQSQPRKSNYDIGPVDVPEPIMDVTQSRSRWSELDEHAMTEEEWGNQTATVAQQPTGHVSDSLTDVLSMPLNHAPSTVVEDDPFPDTTDDEADIDDIDDNGDNDNNESPWHELEVTDDIRQRLLPTRQEAVAETMEVLSPSMLRVVIHSMDSQARRKAPTPAQVLQQIRLSGTVLEYCGGWRLSSGSKYHQAPEDSGAHREELRLGDIRVIYLHDAREWRVLDPDHEKQAIAAASPVDIMLSERPRASTMAPEAQEFVKHGYSQCIEQLDGAVKVLVRYVCGLDNELDNQLDDSGMKDAIMTRCDDMRDRQIGALVRRHFCSAVVRLLLIGMYTSRMVGFIKLTVWDLIVTATLAPSATSPPEMRQAYRAVRDLQHNPNMNNDNHVRTRSFICSSLTHHFLHVWLQSLFEDKRTLGRLYEPTAFFRLCTPALFEELLLTLDPLNMLPFRLHTTFEMQQLMAKQRSASVKTRSGPPAANRHARAATITGSNQPAALDRRTSASLPVQSSAMLLEREDEVVLVRAMYNNDVPDDDIELNFQVGDVLMLDQLNPAADPEWCTCTLHGRRGLVPLSYVEILDEIEAATHLATMSSC